MNKEGDALEEWGVNSINAYEQQLLKTNPGSSDHKRIKRFSGELVANPEAYYELLEVWRSQGLNGKQVVQQIRKIEKALLDEDSKGNLGSRKASLFDVVHHYVAQRTGGDTLRRVDQDIRSEARGELRNRYGGWGNIDANLPSIPRGFHLKSDVLKGVEGAALQPYGVTKAGQLSTPKAHTTAPVSKSVTGDIIGATTAREIVEGMSPQFERQISETKAAVDASRPLVRSLDAIAGSTYDTSMSNAELEVRRNVLDANPEQVIKALQENYKPYLFDGGTTQLNVQAIMTKANMPALGGFVHHSRQPHDSAHQTTYTPPKLQPSEKVTLPETPVTPPYQPPSVLENLGGAVEQAKPVLMTGAAIIGWGLQNLGGAIQFMTGGGF